MTDELVKRLDDLDPILETEFDTQIAIQRDPYGATKAIEKSLYLLRDQAARIEALTAEYEEAMECNEQFFVDNEFLKKQVTALTAERASLAMSCLSADGEAQRAWDAQKAAEAERDRLREERDAILSDSTIHSDQREKYERLCARIAAGKASQQDAVDAIRQLCRDNERLALRRSDDRAALKGETP